VSRDTVPIESAPELTIAYDRVGSNYINVTVKLGGNVLAAEKLDVLRPKQRDDFLKRLTKGWPGIDGAAVGAKLLHIAGELTTPNPQNEAPNSGSELDVSRIVRPELFHTPELSGVVIPSVRLSGGKPRGEWQLFLCRHTDRRREKRPLDTRIELPGGECLWLHPVPGEPLPTVRPGWSDSARRQWLDGAPTPDAAELFRRICERLAYYLDFPPESAAGALATLTLWAMLTYCYPAWSTVPYLSIGGALGSGKTTVFRLLARLVFRAIESSNMTAACLFRTLHECGGVLLLDEAERLRDGSPEAGELRSILLSGYKRGSPAMRLEKVGDGFRRAEFDVYGPKALASIASLPEALSSRCIQLTMLRARPDSSKPRRRIDADAATWQALRDDLHAIALQNGATWLALASCADVVPSTLAGRDFELWQPLLALARWLDDAGAGGLCSLVRDFAIEAAESARDDATPAADETLLRLLAESVVAGTHFTLTAGALAKRAREVDETTFKTWSAKGVSNTLKRYGCVTHKSRGVKAYGRVELARLRRIERAYGLDLGLPPENVPSNTLTYPQRQSQPENGLLTGHVVRADVPSTCPILGEDTGFRVLEGT